MYKPALNRRQLLKGVSASLGVLALRGFEVHAASPLYFTHGVASGDPLSDRVILWTRLIPGSGEHRAVDCRWEVASDPQFMQLVNSGVVSTSAKRDYTLKVDAQGLEPGSAYFYRFLSEGIISPVGQTRTLPEGAVESFRIGVASCSNYPQGYFNVYRHMADSDLDLVLHLGDYIYEYAEGVYANAVATEELGRQVEPATEILTVEDYRMRYGLYRTDPDLQAVHARHPFICVWDDHELANDSWKDGAENHNQGEGDFQARMTAARQAYHEWLPIRTAISGDQGPIFRSFKVGGLADLIMLDTRLHGRDRGLDYAVDLPLRTLSYDVSKTGQGTMVSSADAAVAPAHQRRLVKLPFDFSTGEPTAITDYGLIKDLTAETLPKNWHYLPDTESFKEQMLIDPARALLGADQEQWLDTELQASKQRGATWQLLGQQVLMGKLKLPVLTDQQLKLDDAMPAYREILKMMQLLAPEQLPFNLDAWDGYAVCRDRVYASLAEHGVNPVVLAGDTHNAWAFNLANNMGEAVGVEIGTPSVSSPGLETYLPTDPIVLGNAMVEASAELFAVDTAHRGWSELVLTSQAMTNQWHFVDTILDRQFTTKTAEKQHCKVGNKRFS
ncbi:MAG: alkaline phosphatase D [Parasphingorhabdus sp.]|jgi:alkaline phosphatase D|tara:strand:+ start:3014 stop:4855 length:1842 start_codon:yes stop_codon:yes gene_type:complete